MKKTRYDPANKYTQCYCDKKQIILLGWGINIYANIFASAALVVFCVATLFIDPVGWPVLIALGEVAGWIFLLKWTYRDFFKKMQKAGHSIHCSKRIARKAMMCHGQWSSFKINVDPKEVDPQGDYGTPAVALWFTSFVVNSFYIMLFGYEDTHSKSLFFPILFLTIMMGSLILLIRIKDIHPLIVVLMLLNIVTSSLLLIVYLLALFV